MNCERQLSADLASTCVMVAASSMARCAARQGLSQAWCVHLVAGLRGSPAAGAGCARPAARSEQPGLQAPGLPARAAGPWSPAPQPLKLPARPGPGGRTACLAHGRPAGTQTAACITSALLVSDATGELMADRLRGRSTLHGCKGLESCIQCWSTAAYVVRGSKPLCLPGAVPSLSRSGAQRASLW